MLKKLKAWLKKPGNSKSKLAYLLGYKSSSTITNWLSRKSIPEYMTPQLKEIFKQG